MSLDRTQTGRWLVLCIILVIICASILLVACGTVVAPIAAPAAMVLTDTPIQTTYTPNGKGQFGTHVALTEEAMGTSAALTGVPTWTPGRPPSYPSPTPELGLHSGSGARNSQEPFFITGWTGIVNGELINVESGREGSLGDPQQGVIMLYNRTTRQPAEIYRTPQKSGPVRIVAVNGTLFTLAPIDLHYYETPGALQTPWATSTPGSIFIFDLATGQWLDPAGTPIPTTPLPTTSPIP